MIRNITNDEGVTTSYQVDQQELSSLLTSSPVVLGGTSLMFGAAVALVLLLMGSLFIQPKQMMEYPSAF
jgi:hypothetical protein